jgi:hypothetical protein
MDPISEANRVIKCVADRLRDHRERIAALEARSLDASDEREQAAVVERDLGTGSPGRALTNARCSRSLGPIKKDGPNVDMEVFSFMTTLPLTETSHYYAEG